ncbi:MAG: hypothetical protein IPH35_21110 [Rhodoferax sp.]|nr:hypothetical protein [Rhodoferax sp.]
MQAIRYEASVGADHALHVPTPDLPEGTVAEIIVLVRQRPQPAHRDWTQHFGEFARFDSLEALNRYVDELREE